MQPTANGFLKDFSVITFHRFMERLEALSDALMTANSSSTAVTGEGLLVKLSTVAMLSEMPEGETMSSSKAFSSSSSLSSNGRSLLVFNVRDNTATAASSRPWLSSHRGVSGSQKNATNWNRAGIPVGSITALIRHKVKENRRQGKGKGGIAMR